MLRRHLEKPGAIVLLRRRAKAHRLPSEPDMGVWFSVQPYNYLMPQSAHGNHVTGKVRCVSVQKQGRRRIRVQPSCRSRTRPLSTLISLLKCITTTWSYTILGSTV